jgi:SAM-dependent methyltransferase
MARWEAQQTWHIPLREERFGVIGDAVAEFAGDAPLILDLGCGPGSLSRRLLDRLPGARAVGVDADPLLLELGRRNLGDGDGSLRLVDADLRDPAWVERLPDPGPYDAVVSTTALHWLTRQELGAVLHAAAGLLREGGIFVNGDHIQFGPGAPRIAEARQGLGRRVAELTRARGDEDWQAWWEAIEREPALADLAAQRRARWHEHPHVDDPGLTDQEWHDLLAKAGFAESAVLWQHLGTSVVAALR